MQSNRDEKKEDPQVVKQQQQSSSSSILPDFKNFNQHEEFDDELHPAAIVDQYYT